MGFYKFLFLLKNFDFEMFPMIIDWGNVMDEDDANEIDSNFQKARKESRGKWNIFLASLYDKQSKFWTESTPTMMVI